MPIVPCRGAKALATDPEGYAYSSLGSYARKSRQVVWIAYDEHHRYWLGLNDGKNPSSSYRTFVKEGPGNSTDPKVQRFKDWVYGGEDFLKSLLAMAGGKEPEINARRVRRTKARSAHQIIGIVAEHYAVDASGYREFRGPAGGRDLAAYLCRRYRGATLRELSIDFGLSHSDGSANLVRRAKARLQDSAEDRYITIGLSDRGRLLIVWHTDRGDVTCVIGARHADKLETKAYNAQRS